jgi:hypothetical protein
LRATAATARRVEAIAAGLNAIFDEAAARLEVTVEKK